MLPIVPAMVAAIRLVDERTAAEMVHMMQNPMVMDTCCSEV